VLRSLAAAAGLEDIETRAIDVPTTFRNFEDYWTPFLGGQGPAPTYCAKLSETARAKLRTRLENTLPAQTDGSIHLTARAWAMRGIKPASTEK
jgi:hypothetical protein